MQIFINLMSNWLGTGTIACHHLHYLAWKIDRNVIVRPSPHGGSNGNHLNLNKDLNSKNTQVFCFQNEEVLEAFYELYILQFFAMFFYISIGSTPHPVTVTFFHYYMFSREIPIHTHPVATGWVIDLAYLRIFQHTPGTYPRPPTNGLWRNSFHLGIYRFLGYAPRVCWGFLRT